MVPGMPEDIAINQTRLRAIVRTCDAELHWRLTDTQQQQYVVDLLRCRSDRVFTPEELQRSVRMYHADHAHVYALQDDRDPNHQHAWQEMETYVRRVLWQQAGHSFPNAHDIIDETTGYVLEAISKSLRTYCYKAQLTTWVHKIIINKYRNYLRDRRILNPQFDIVPDDVHDLPLAISAVDQPAMHLEGKALEELVTSILQESPLMQQVFWLSVVGFKLAEIGQRVGRSTTRVHELIRQARTLIQTDARFQAWLDDPSEPNEEQPE
jgi:RNA polymerase sigma factor (sigma-70 family)